MFRKFLAAIGLGSSPETNSFSPSTLHCRTDLATDDIDDCPIDTSFVDEPNDEFMDCQDAEKSWTSQQAINQSMDAVNQQVQKVPVLRQDSVTSPQINVFDAVIMNSNHHGDADNGKPSGKSTGRKRSVNESSVEPPVEVRKVPTCPAACYLTVCSVAVETVSGTNVKIVTGKDGRITLKVVVPDSLAPEPHQGDRLIARFKEKADSCDLLVPESVVYARTRDDVLLAVVETFEGLNGRKFVIFEKNACCDLSAVPENGSLKRGALYKVGLVESRQPKYNVWRAHSLQFIGISEARDVSEDSFKIVVDKQVEFGSIPFGGTLANVITLRNTDPENRWMLMRMSVSGLPLQLIGPVHISEPHFVGDPPGSFHPSIDYFPFKDIKARLSSLEEKQVTVRLIGTTPGKLDFAVHFHFNGRVTQTCLVTATVLQSDGGECQAVLEETALLRNHRNIGRDLCRGEARDRLKGMVESQRTAGVVRPPKMIFPEDDKAWPAKFRSQFLIPDIIMDLMNSTADLALNVLIDKFPVFGQPLTIGNYADKFHLLLFLEEYYELVAVRSFDLVSDELRLVEEDTYRLKMENLQEQRPSLIRGDVVSVRSVVDKDGPRYQGRIVKIGLDTIDLIFDAKFGGYFKPDQLLDFAFVPNRNCYRRTHNILNVAKRNLSSRLFFPDIKNRERCIRRIEDALEASEKLDFVNESLNDRQREAVKMVVLGRCQPVAHIIFGPPGTGKTVTVIETIIQIYLRSAKSRLLICAPSNAAADLIGQKIIESSAVPPEAVRRILCVQRSHDKVPVELADSVQTGCLEDLPKHQRIILTTCLSASYLVELIQDFTHVIIDEAGFAVEPEILIPLAAVAGRPDVQVVLAGDPNQLGPVVFSPHAKELGLEKSLLSRLLDLPAYREWTDPAGNTLPYCPFLVSKLNLNYRAVESLLKIPSKFFYNCQLKSQIPDHENIYAPRLGLPALTFWPVKSVEHRESRSPSVANPGQVEVVCQLMQNLLTVGIDTENIGIITPYRLQAEYIRKALLKAGLGVPKIGTVEEFQGQEKDAIILSTVRARRNITEDSAVNDVLGFVACPKRTNVALTRARFVLMLVGDPTVLCLDKHWKGILRYCYAKDLYQKDLYNDREYLPPWLSEFKAPKSIRTIDPVLPAQEVPEVPDSAFESAE